MAIEYDKLLLAGDIGTDVQAWSAALDTVVTLSSANSNFIVGSAVGWVVESEDTARHSLGLGTADSPTFANLSLGTGELTCGSINRAAGALTLEIGGVTQVTITDATVAVVSNITTTAGFLASGVADTTRGYLYLHAGASGYGGSAYFGIAADSDDIINTYNILTYEDDLRIGTDVDNDIITITAGVAVGITTILNVTGAVTAANYTAANLLTACATNAGGLDFSAASKTLTVEDNAIVSQDYSVGASPRFYCLTLTHDLILDGSIDADVVFKDGATLRAEIGLDASNNLEITSQTGLITFLSNNILTTGDIKCEQLTLSETTQDYLFTDLAFSTTSLALQSQTSGNNFSLNFYTKDGDGSDSVGIRLWAKSTPASYTNYESLQIGYVAARLSYEIYSAQHGTGEGAGIVRPIYIYTKGNIDQMVFQNDGDVEIGAGPLDFTLTMANSAKDPTTDAPADWVEVKIGGTTYYIPAYAAS